MSVLAGKDFREKNRQVDAVAGLPVPVASARWSTADTAINVIQGIRDGDAKAVTTGLSTAGGAGRRLCRRGHRPLVLPGIGTAVGGAIGGLLGSEAGAWLGDKLFSPADRLPAPNAVSKELNSACTDNVQVTLAPQHPDHRRQPRRCPAGGQSGDPGSAIPMPADALRHPRGSAQCGTGRSRR